MQGLPDFGASALAIDQLAQFDYDTDAVDPVGCKQARFGESSMMIADNFRKFSRGGFPDN